MNTNFKKELEGSIDILKKGQSFKIDEFVLGLSRSKNNLKELKRLMVYCYLFYDSIKDVPKDKIKEKLDKAKEKFTQILNESIIFNEFALNVGIDYYLLLDYQSGSIIVCAEIEGEYKSFI